MISPKKALSRLAVAADIPGGLSGSLPEIRITGMRTAVIGPHRGISSFAGDCVLVESGAGLICIRGQNLILRSMTRQEIRLAGQIQSVERVESHEN